MGESPGFILFKKKPLNDMKMFKLLRFYSLSKTDIGMWTLAPTYAPSEFCIPIQICGLQNLRSVGGQQLHAQI